MGGHRVTLALWFVDCQLQKSIHERLVYAKPIKVRFVNNLLI